MEHDIDDFVEVEPPIQSLIELELDNYTQIERIANALGLPESATLAEIVAEIRKLQRQSEAAR